MMIINFSDWSFLPTLFLYAVSKKVLKNLIWFFSSNVILKVTFSLVSLAPLPKYIPHVEEEKKHVVLFGN